MKNIQDIEKKLADYAAKGKQMFVTSSFQTHSIPLLHIISKVDPSIPVYYLNTGFLFPETIEFKNELQSLLNLQFIAVEPSVPKSQQKDAKGQLLFTSDPDYCCYLNKIQPMEVLLNKYNIWINGIRADQNRNRAQMEEEQATPQGALRYHPMLKWTTKDIFEYRKEFNLPPHPLEAKGFLSIGCEPCTRKSIDENEERNSRWFGLNKVECGLHTDLVKK